MECIIRKIDISHIKFNADINFLPIIKGSIISGIGKYVTQVGVSHLVGNIIFLTCNIEWTTHTGTGNMLIDNLPATVSNLLGYNPEVIITLENISFPTGTGYIVGEFQTNSSNITINEYRSNQSRSSVSMSSSGKIHLSGFYLTTQEL